MEFEETMKRFEMTGTAYDKYFMDFMYYYGGDGHDIVKWEPYDRFMVCVYYANGNKAYYDAVGSIVKNVGRRQPDVEFIDEELYASRFAWRLRSAINASSLSRAEICERTGISNASLSGYISGRVMPTIGKLYKLAKVLRCPVEDLVNAGDLDL